MGKLENIEKAIERHRPRRCYVRATLKGREVDIPAAEAHRLIHSGALDPRHLQTGASPSPFSEKGNSAVDLEALLHILFYHKARDGDTSRHSLPLNVGPGAPRDLKEALIIHEALLKDYSEAYLAATPELYASLEKEINIEKEIKSYEKH